MGCLYTVKQAARKLMLDPQSIYRLLNDGTLKGNKTASGIWRISQDQLNQFIQGGARQETERVLVAN